MKGIQYLGPLPAEIQNITVFSDGIHSGTKEMDAATALAKSLTAGPCSQCQFVTPEEPASPNDPGKTRFVCVSPNQRACIRAPASMLIVVALR